jgi:hypothetical protein
MLAITAVFICSCAAERAGSSRKVNAYGYVVDYTSEKMLKPAETPDTGISERAAAALESAKKENEAIKAEREQNKAKLAAAAAAPAPAAGAPGAPANPPVSGPVIGCGSGKISLTVNGVIVDFYTNTDTIINDKKETYDQLWTRVLNSAIKATPLTGTIEYIVKNGVNYATKVTVP